MIYPGFGRKIVLVGAGLVGMSYSYALLNQGLCDELVLIDINKKRAEGEASDLGHGLAFASTNMRIRTGEYDDCEDADIVTICAGVAQRPEESRIDLLERNAAVFEDVVGKVVKSGFSGIFLVATNPVDIMTRITQAISGFPPNRVIGSGTTLDTARLRYMLGGYFAVDPRNVHAYVIGEHGESEFVPWSQAMIGTKPILNVCDDNPNKYKYEDLLKISDDVKNAAAHIIEAKGATYYGIGMSLARITRAILGDENSILTVSSMLYGEYGQEDVYVGSPNIINRDGAKSTVRLSLTDHELKTFYASCEFLKECYNKIHFGKKELHLD